MNNNILKSIGKSMSKFCAKTKAHSPEILVVAGVVGVVASAILACKASTKVSTIIHEAKEQIDDIHDVAEKEEYKDEYTREDMQKDLAIVYTQTAVKFVKLYALPVVLGGLSIAGILTSNGILRRRNLALAAAYTAVDKGFKEYRSRVVDKFGEKVDNELRYGIKARKIEETVTDPETGKEKQVKKTVEVIDPNLPSDYACYFDRRSRNYNDNADYDMFFLRAQQNYLNDLLIARGHVFLNEVYDALDLPRTAVGQIVGWVRNTNDPNADGYIDFRIMNVNREAGDGRIEPAIVLDFNVDGPVLEKI